MISMLCFVLLGCLLPCMAIDRLAENNFLSRNNRIDNCFNDRLIMQDDGNLVLYGRAGSTVLWQARTAMSTVQRAYLTNVCIVSCVGANSYASEECCNCKTTLAAL